MRPLIYSHNIPLEIINEIMNNPIDLSDYPLEYTIIEHKIDRVEFTTEKGTEYVVELSTNIVNSNINIGGNILLSSLLNISPINNKFDVYDMGFTIKNRFQRNNIITYEKYTKLTNEYDQYNVFNCIISSLKIYISTNTTANIFMIDKNIRKSILNISKYIYNKSFSNDFEFFETKNAYLFIKKSILK